MQKSDRTKEFYRDLLLYYFDSKKNASETHKLLTEVYGDAAPSYTTCKFWFARFKSGDFNVKDKERSGQPKKFEDEELQALLDENSAQSLKELSEALNVGQTTVYDRLHAMGKVPKDGKWIPRELLPDGHS